MKFIAVICTILLATSTGFATPLAAPAVDISVESPALEGRQSNTNLCAAINAAQGLASQGITTANPSSVIDSFAKTVQGIFALSGTTMPPGFDDSIKKIEAQASSGTATATAAITSGFAEMNTILKC